MAVIQQFSKGRDNNFNLLRLLAASFIAFYHCLFMVYGPSMSDVRFPYLYDLSQIVLNFFFITSGFLIAQSFARRGDVISYFVARFLRLVPGLFVLSLLICLMIGPLVTEVSLSEYFSSLNTLLYVPLTTMLDPDRVLPGVFASNINAYEIDQALWTLQYEVVCYIGLAVLGVVGLLKTGRSFNMVCLLIFASYGFVTYLTDLRNINAINHMMHFGLSFFVGVVFYIYEDRIELSNGLVIVCLLIAGVIYFVAEKRVSEPFIILATAYLIFWLAYIPDGFVREYNQLGDYSYGVYIYHFPIEQCLVYFFGGFSPFGLFALALPLTLICAVLSWKFVERPALDQLPVMSEWIKTNLFKIRIMR